MNGAVFSAPCYVATGMFGRLCWLYNTGNLKINRVISCYDFVNCTDHIFLCGLSPITGYLVHLHLKLRRLEEELHKVIELMNETEPCYDSEKNTSNHPT